MEQLSGAAVGKMLAAAGSAGRARRRTPWPEGPERNAVSPAAPAGDAPFSAAEPNAPATPAAIAPVGLERRLVRRAEGLWSALAPASIPPDSLAGRLLAPPFEPFAMRITLPPHPADPSCRLPRVVAMGAALAGLGLLVPGTAESDPRPGAPLGARLVALAERAVALGEPAHFDSEADPALSLPQHRPAAGHPFLLRAIALPFAPAAGAGGSAIVIASWRRLLSTEETAALHTELAAAVAWMQANAPGPV